MPVLPTLRRRADFEAIGRRGTVRSTPLLVLRSLQDRSSRDAGRAVDAPNAGRSRSAQSSPSEVAGTVPRATGEPYRSRVGPAPHREAGYRRGEPCRVGRRARRAPGSIGDRPMKRIGLGIDRGVPEALVLDAAKLPLLTDLLGLHVPGDRGVRAPARLVDGRQAHRPMQPVSPGRVRPGPSEVDRVQTRRSSEPDSSGSSTSSRRGISSSCRSSTC